MQTAIDLAAIANQDPLKTAYQALQWGKNIFAIAHKDVAARVGRTLFPQNALAQGRARVSIGEAELAALKVRYDKLLEQDWKDAKAGFYPMDLLFDTPWDEVVRTYPAVWLDLPKMWQRTQEKRYQEFSQGIDTRNYPKYYLQNFHYQTDGYLSDTSASLYDLQVELLFGGMADPMRRRILPLLKRCLDDAQTGDRRRGEERSPKILDIACGTGRTLRQLRAALPDASLYGVDLSPAYLRKANQLLCQNRGDLPQLLQANAEALPYQGEYFDAVTSVFLFHELPATARQSVIDECYRVLAPGGTLVVCDSIQMTDSAELSSMMEGFSETFHEPYYKDYVRDDLAPRLEAAGFSDIAAEAHFLSKYFTARKPLG
jgi:ubiquinone/menaquinone biosynthesis C-methylase UbiE